MLVVCGVVAAKHFEKNMPGPRAECRGVAERGFVFPSEGLVQPGALALEAPCQ